MFTRNCIFYARISAPIHMQGLPKRQASGQSNYPWQSAKEVILGFGFAVMAGSFTGL